MHRSLPPVLAALALLAAAPLAGCGFTPLYATPGLVSSLDAVDVVVEQVRDPRRLDPLQNRIHYLLREQLNDELGHAGTAPVRYQLICATTERRYPRGVRVNNVANRYEINFTVRYTLKAVGDTRVLLQGAAPVLVDYDSADPPYAGVAAERDGEDRAANQAAIQIRLALSRYFAGYHSGSHPVETPAPQNALDDAPGSNIPAPRRRADHALAANAMILSKRPEVEPLAGPPAGVRAVVIWGKDRGGVRERADALAARIAKVPDDPFDVALLTETDLEREPARLEEELAAISMMGGRRLVRLKLTGEKAGPDKAAAEALTRHAEGALNPDAFFLIEAGALERTSALRKAAEKADAAASIPVYEDETGDVSRMVREAMSKDGVSLTSDALELFVTRLPRERGVARQEIERLILYLGPRSGAQASAADLTDHLGVEPEASLADAAQDAFGGRAALAQSALRRARAEGEGGPAAVRALSQHLAKLRRAAILQADGAAAQAAAKASGVFWKNEREFLRQLRTWKLPELEALSAEMLEADTACKQTAAPDHLISERLALSIAGRARRLGL